MAKETGMEMFFSLKKSCSQRRIWKLSLSYLRELCCGKKHVLRVKDQLYHYLTGRLRPSHLTVRTHSHSIVCKMAPVTATPLTSHAGPN